VLNTVRAKVRKDTKEKRVPEFPCPFRGVVIRQLAGIALALAGLAHFANSSADGSAGSSAKSALAAPCDTPQHHQFDYWVGDWQVFDADSQQLVAVDRVEKHAEGCIIQQNLTFITDMYRRPGVNYRLAGIGVNRFDGEAWLQIWADNQWGAIVMRGTADANGSMTFKSIIPSRNRDLRIIWEKRADGTVRNVEYVAPAGTEKWEKYGDLIYRRNR
jgi:hypothetical protein